jgi:hypothetical protein
MLMAKMAYGAHVSEQLLLRLWWRPLGRRILATGKRFTEERVFCMKKELRNEVYSIAT